MEIALHKSPAVVRKIASHRLKILGGGGGGVVKHFSEFAKGIYEICDHNFFNLAIIIFLVVFSIV